MDTSVDRARAGLASAKARHGLTEAKLRELQPGERAYKVSDGGNGLYVVVSPSGSRFFRYDYRLSGRRETLTIGRHEPVARHAQRSHLAYGMDVTLEEARLLLARARVDVSSGRSPARAKVEQRSDVADAMSFGRWATRYFEFKSDAKSGAKRLADSTLSLRRSIYNRILAGPFGKLNLDEIKPVALGELLDRVKTERGPGPAVHARELVLQVYRFATGKGVDVANPAEALARKAYATFVPRERNLSRPEIKALLDGLERTGTAPTLRLAVRFMLLTGVRKGEFIGATWPEVDWERAQWLIPAERMKAGKPHTVYLAEQALDILTTLRTCFPSSRFVHPSRHDSSEPIRQATLNLLLTNREPARHLVHARLAGDTSHLTAHAGRGLGALLTGDRDEGLRLVKQLLDAGDTYLVLLAEGYMFATHPTTYAEIDVEALYRIYRSENGVVLRYASRITMEVARRDKSLAIDLLSSANIDLAMRSAGDFFMWLAHEETIPFDLIRDDQLRRLIDGLRSIPRLDDHWVNAFLKKAIQRAPGVVLDLAKARIDASIASDDWSMQPLGSVFRDRDALDLLALPDGVLLLRDLLDWALARIGDYRFSYRFAEMLQSLCSPYDATCVATIEDWLNAGGTAEHFKVVTAIVRDAGATLVFDNEGFIARALRAARAVGRKVFKELSSAIFATSVSGLRSGAPGQPFEADVRLKELAELRLARITRADPTYDLYVSIRGHAAQDIERQLADGRRMDEADADA